MAILSGLYGVLRPLDWMQPYRLEDGTAWPRPQGANLYHFWGPRIARHLDEQLAGRPEPVVVNLGRRNISRPWRARCLQPRVLDCVFQDLRGGHYKLIGFFAKRARGLMARWAIQERRATGPSQLQGFGPEGYAFALDASTPTGWSFAAARPRSAHDAPPPKERHR